VQTSNIIKYNQQTGQLYKRGHNGTDSSNCSNGTKYKPVVIFLEHDSLVHPAFEINATCMHKICWNQWK